MTFKTINQKVFFKALPKEIYSLIMDEHKHSEFTSSKVKIKNVEDTKFTAWDGYIEGENVELLEGKKIVQKWRAEEENWPKKHYSTVTFIFREKDGGTEMEFEQTGVPSEVYDTILTGWDDYYWEPIRGWIKDNI